MNFHFRSCHCRRIPLGVSAPVPREIRKCNWRDLCNLANFDYSYLIEEKVPNNMKTLSPPAIIHHFAFPTNWWYSEYCRNFALCVWFAMRSRWWWYWCAGALMVHAASELSAQRMLLVVSRIAYQNAALNTACNLLICPLRALDITKSRSYFFHSAGGMGPAGRWGGSWEDVNIPNYYV